MTLFGKVQGKMHITMISVYDTLELYRVKFTKLLLLLLIGDSENASDWLPNDADLGKLASGTTF